MRPQVVDCVEQREVGGRLRCRVFLGVRRGSERYGWISAKTAAGTPLIKTTDGTPLIQRHAAAGGAAESERTTRTQVIISSFQILANSSKSGLLAAIVG